MSRRPYDITDEARVDLLGIWAYLAEHASIQVADRIADDIEGAIAKLSASPRLGHRRADLAPEEMLFYRVHSYFVIYHATLDPLTVLRVLHTSRNLKRLLEQ